VPLLSNMEIRGMSKGTRQNARESVITVLRSRLGEVSTEVTNYLNSIEDLSLLKQLLEKAVTANSFVEFQEFLDRQGK
jgi:hypothetical protein